MSSNETLDKIKDEIVESIPSNIKISKIEYDLENRNQSSEMPPGFQHSSILQNP